MKVFISHSYNDHCKFNEIVEKLKIKIPEFENAELWDPSTNLTVGSNFREEIKKQILSSDTYVLLWTKGAADSPWVLYEAGMAYASGKPIVIVVEPDSPQLFAVFNEYRVIKLGNES